MRIVTWNLGRRKPAEAWAYLREELKPDIALLQEVRPPLMEADEALVLEEVVDSWGTAVYSRGIPLTRMPLTSEYPSRVAAAEALMCAGQVVRIASIHAPIIGNRVFPHLACIFEEIESAFEEHTAIIGGDLNSARLAEKVWPGHGHGRFFERFDDGPWVDAHYRLHREERQTFFRPGQVHPFQDDHIFFSADLEGVLRACTVVDNGVTRKLSDHIPVMAELDLSRIHTTTTRKP